MFEPLLKSELFSNGKAGTCEHDSAFKKKGAPPQRSKKETPTLNGVTWSRNEKRAQTVV